MSTQPTDHPQPDPLANTDHFCIPCDVETMARRLNIDKRRVQQLAREGVFQKTERGEYVCPHNVLAYCRTLQVPKRTKASGLTKKQEESLDIRNARDRMEVLAEWETMVQRRAIVEELAPLFLALRNGIRQMSGSLSRDIVLFVKEHAEKIANSEQLQDYELDIRARKMLDGQINEKLATISKGLAAWAEPLESGADNENRIAVKASKFWIWVKKRF